MDNNLDGKTPAAARMTPGLIFAVTLLTAAGAFNYLGRMLVGVLGPDIKRDLGLSDTEFGLLTGPAFALSYAAATIVFGVLADRYSRRLLISAGFMFWSAMLLLSGFASNVIQLGLARAGFGIAASGLTPAGFSYLTDSNVPPHRRGTVFGIFYAGSMLGILAAFVLGGGVAAYYGWRMSFIVAGALGMCLAIALPFLISEPPRTNVSTAQARPSFAEALSLFAKNRPYLFIMLGISIGNFAGPGLVAWLPLFFARSHGLNPTTLAFVFGPALALGMTVGMLSGGWVGDRISRLDKTAPLRLCVGAVLTVMVLYWIILSVPFLSVALVLIVIAAALSVMYIPAYNVVLPSILGPQVKATGLSVLVFMTNICAIGILPMVVGVLSDAFAPRFGTDALRYALMVVLSGNLISAWAFNQARRSIR